MDEKLLEISKQFWDAMEHADEAGMLKYADPPLQFCPHRRHLQAG